MDAFMRHETGIILLLWALTHAGQDAPTLFSSRIDGLLFPFCSELEFWL